MIRGEVIDLRPVRERDLDRLFELETDIANRGRYYPLEFRSESELRHRFQETGFWSEHNGRLLIISKGGGIVGSIGFFRPASYFDAYEIAYILYDESSRGKGYVSEALQLFTRYLIAIKKAGRLQLTVMVGNVASRRVAEKAGFRPEGILRHAIYLRGRNHDLEMFSLLPGDLEQDEEAGGG
jgi:RimJ/RimL family protein N-acetyltransferase